MDKPSVREVSERIDVLLDELAASAPPAVLERTEELLRCVMALYGSGLEHVLSTLGSDAARQLADDEVVGNLLVLHDLHPDDLDTRVQRALDDVRPYLGSHAGGVSVSAIDEEQGIVHLQLEGSCDGCPSSSLTVKNAIEAAILAAAPDIVAVEAEGMVAEAGPSLLQIEPFRPHGEESGGGWQHLELDVPPRTLSSIDVAGASVLFANLDGNLVAYLDRCPACFEPLSRGVLDADELACVCGRGYDLRLAGRTLTGDDIHLAPLPLLPERGAWKVSLPRGADA